MNPILLKERGFDNYFLKYKIHKNRFAAGIPEHLNRPFNFLVSRMTALVLTCIFQVSLGQTTPLEVNYSPGNKRVAFDKRVLVTRCCVILCM